MSQSGDLRQPGCFRVKSGQVQIYQKEFYMKKLSSVIIPVVGGSLLVILGVLLLLNNFKVIEMDWSLLVGPIIALGGLFFILVFIIDRRNWWALIPGCILLAIGAIIILSSINQEASAGWSGAIILFAIGLSFWLIYINNNSNWWAIIPGGVLWSLAGLTLVPDETWFKAGLFFLGLAVTFLLVYVLPKPEGRMKWALYPAGALALVGLLASAGADNWMKYIWPFALLAGGVVTLILALRRKK